MADFYDHIDDERKAFIEAQHMFFVATAPSDPNDGFPNLSPNCSRIRSKTRNWDKFRRDGKCRTLD